MSCIFLQAGNKLNEGMFGDSLARAELGQLVLGMLLVTRESGTLSVCGLWVAG